MPQTRPRGHLALPATGTGRPVLVLHAWWGLNDTIAKLCARLADVGFVAFAPDLFRGQVADTIPGAEALSDGHDRAQAKSDIADATRLLLERAGDSDDELAVIGFSFGAFYALDLSVADPEHVRSVVLFYGTRPGDYRGSKASYLGHYAESDPYEPQSEVDGLEKALRDAGRPVTFHRYAGVGHWFFEPDRTEAFNAEAATLAWNRTLAFLRGERAR